MCTDRPCTLRLNLHNFIELRFQFQAYWRGAKPRDFTLSNLRKVRIEKEWINWGLNLILTTENTDQRGQLFERILGVPPFSMGKCVLVHAL
jgi:hypothetical protein